nr:PIN domain-containing protein [Aphanothece hegewaldii]
MDTLYWVALTNSNDQWHERAKSIQASLVSCNLITTEAVLIEYLNYFSLYNSFMRQTVVGITNDILEDSKIEVVPITHDLFLSSLTLYEHRPDKGYSMVDCISMIVMRNRNLSEVLTHDKHFTQEGFSILL